MKVSSRLRAIYQALFVTILWSTSWVLIKKFLDEIPPLTFAGLRYTVAFIILMPGLRKHKKVVKCISRKEWLRLILLGFVFYAITQGGQFLTLTHLDAITFSLLLNFSSVLVALFSIIILHEVPTIIQWGGILVFIIGVMLYFLPISSISGTLLGFTLAGLTVCANAYASVLGRSINRESRIPAYVVTVISMGVGAGVLLVTGLVTDGIPNLSSSAWLVIIWLAAVNTALAFTIWNKSLRVLTALESSNINNTMLIQIAILAWLFLGERLTFIDGVGLLLAVLGVFLVHMRRPKEQHCRECD